jgi:hypothetical protein
LLTIRAFSVAQFYLSKNVFCGSGILLAKEGLFWEVEPILGKS